MRAPGEVPDENAQGPRIVSSGGLASIATKDVDVVYLPPVCASAVANPVPLWDLASSSTNAAMKFLMMMMPKPKENTPKQYTRRCSRKVAAPHANTWRQKTPSRISSPIL